MLLALIRSIIFYIIIFFFSIAQNTLGIIIGLFLPYELRYRFIITTWTSSFIWLLKVICGVRYEITGKHNIPDQPCLISSNHQSSWETFFLQSICTPQTQVIKRELLWIPFFGWAYSLLKPIAINRGDKQNARAQVLEQGSQYLNSGIWVLIFPEGTRNPPKKLGRYARSGAALAINAGVPVLPIAHNSGHFYINKEFIKYPGTIQVHIGQPISSEGKTAEQLTDEVRAWTERSLQAIEGVEQVSSTFEHPSITG
ncbi:lysophospholipid acyltransferase family protein [Litoribrevibacter albus]|uniref:Lysophosphatidic acid acyltransferase n=1 Tax=Litoribrevibacter albus TaxID=1473156 RepID=A0AA37SDA3_9GAMM|nr:lysophospholipid acyltransferase family protein [Litoribrevibacter albus]GLQ32926.1 lysophosphatidic acid acyltransferase [Litoribrevibacter albus]